MRHWLAACLFCLGISSLDRAVARAAEPLDFNRDIRPILSNNCFFCHGPDEAERKGGVDGLRLDTPEGAAADLGSGTKAITPGKPDASELLKRITSTDADEMMPPKATGKKLSAREIETLRTWIAQGAPYAKHWSYVAPKRPPVPQVKNQSWPRNDIDRFILARLEREGLQPAPEADPYTLMRRLSLDLTGLPPTVEEVDRFAEKLKAESRKLKDNASNRDSAAFSSQLSAFLSSPRFGEHWARMWLDLARYADSAGYADDPTRTIWAYRDYVIRSFNANKPFDQFTLEQLAGDLLPNPTEEQLMATAFHRNTLTNNEGGTNDEEFRNVAIVDRVNTTMAVWMGTSMACAQCHSHKYDPISQEDYFRFFAILNNTEDADRRDESPLLNFYTDEQKQQRSDWEGELAKLDETFKKFKPTATAAAEQWESKFPKELKWHAIKPTNAKSNAAAELAIDDSGAVLVAKPEKNDNYTLELPLEMPRLAGLRLDVLTNDKLPGKGPGHAGGNFIVSRISASIVPPVVNNDGDKKPSPAATAIPLKFVSAYADVASAGFSAAAVLADKVDRTKGWSSGAGKNAALTLIADGVANIPAGSKLRVVIEHQAQQANQVLGHFRLSISDDARVDDYAKTPAAIVKLLTTPVEQRKPAERDQLLEHFVREVAPELNTERKRTVQLKQSLADLKPNTVPIFRELAADKRRKTLIQRRGNFLDTGAEVTPGVISTFHPLKSGVQPDRLGLAQWLVDEQNPLTARVIANRFWEQIFGVGLVRTSEEFGSQGEQPSNPELLDFLATELIRLKWNMKEFVTLLVSSAAYRQSSQVSRELADRDPENRLLARGPRFRLSAEMVRDQALAVSGLLSPRMYGPSVKPPRPSLGLNAAFGSGLDWQTSSGEDKFRRGIYTEWRRSAPYPSMATFDAPNREVCTIRRNSTNTPLQALVTLNDPVYVETAQALARRMVAGAKTPREQVTLGFRLCLARPPQEKEVARLVALFEETRSEYAAKPEQAKQMATVPLGAAPAGVDLADLAAWTVVSNVLLNLDEVLMKR